MTDTAREAPTTEVTLPAIEFAEKTDPGRDPNKQVNEDASGCRATRFGHLAVVCDGMGGHAGGREASHLALATIFEVFDTAAPETPPSVVLEESIVLANRRVHAMPTDEAGGRPGSTVVAILVHSDGTEVAHVGDSRVYVIHAAQIFQITKDHSMVQELVDAGILTPAQAATHPDANKIMRALGIAPNVDVEVRQSPVLHVAGDSFVLCSDGLSDLVPVDEILRIAGTTPPAQAAGQLVNIANARGGHDNITVLILRTRESAVVTPGRVMTTLNQTSPGASGVGEHGAPGPQKTLIAPVPEAPGSNPASSSGPVSKSPQTTVMTPFGPPLAVLPPNMSQLGGAVRSLRRKQERTTIVAIVFILILLAALAAGFLALRKRQHGAAASVDGGFEIPELPSGVAPVTTVQLLPAPLPEAPLVAPSAPPIPELPALPSPTSSGRHRPKTTAF